MNNTTSKMFNQIIIESAILHTELLSEVSSICSDQKVRANSLIDDIIAAQLYKTCLVNNIAEIEAILKMNKNLIFIINGYRDIIELLSSYHHGLKVIK